MGMKKAKAHEIRCHGFLDRPRQSEENYGTTSTHQEGTVFERHEDDEDDGNEDVNGDDDNDDNDNDDTAFIENFLRSQDVDESYRKRMRSFYKVCFAPVCLQFLIVSA